jgi:hypothetical protein
MPKKTKQLWLIPFYGSYEIEVDKDEGYDSDEIENLFWSEYVGHVQFGDVVDSDHPELLEEYEEEENEDLE